MKQIICVLQRRQGEPPIVKGSIILGSASDFSRHAVNFLHATQKIYGDVFTLRLVNQHLTVTMDPNSYQVISREKNFDFDPIQKQVNMNVFNCFLREPKKMLIKTTKTLKGDMMLQALESFVANLNIACEHISASFKSTDFNRKWQSDSLRHFASKTIFDAIFNNIFGRDDGHRFNSGLVFSNFEIFHKYFKYLWLGFPILLFPQAWKARKQLLCMPESEEL